MPDFTVAVFFGGRSSEREISVITGMLAANLLASRYRVVPVYLPPEGGMETGDFTSPKDLAEGSKKHRVPVRLEGRRLVRVRGGRTLCTVGCALNCCHGGMGEDGTLSALLAFHGVPSASPSMPVSAVFMDKSLSKLVLKGLEIPTLPSFSAEEGDTDTARRAAELGYPVVVKPARLGSSIGIKVANGEEELSRALELAFRLDSRALIEPYLAGRRDINCAAWRRGDEICLSPLEEVFSESSILTFAEKYEHAPQPSKIPAELPEAVVRTIHSATKTVYAAFSCRGVVRADFFVAGEQVYFNELNTVPGSLACHLFGRSLRARRDFLVSLIEEGKTLPPQREIVSSGILESDLFTGGKGAKRR